MNCTAANQLYVRADGRVPCNCDVGENVTLFRPDQADSNGFDYVRDCYNGAPFVGLRESFAAGKPFLPACATCFYFEPDRPFQHYGDAGRLDRIKNVQIESSFHCPVECSACVSKAVRNDPQRSPLGTGPSTMPDELFEKLVDDLAAQGMRVREFFFCGRGEPLLHPRLGEFVRYARKRLPNAYYFAHTSGNVKFSPGVLEFDEITVSIDGARQESYETYRVGGELERCLAFVRDVVKHRRVLNPFARPRGRFTWALPSKHPRYLARLARRVVGTAVTRSPYLPQRPIVRWKYILFEHNDSTDEILEAQRLANEVGADEMQFVLSHTSNRSRRFTSDDQIARDPLFRHFVGRRVVSTTVNDTIDSTSLWDDNEHRIGAKEPVGPQSEGRSDLAAE